MHIYTPLLGLSASPGAQRHPAPAGAEGGHVPVQPRRPREQTIRGLIMINISTCSSSRSRSSSSSSSSSSCMIIICCIMVCIITITTIIIIVTITNIGFTSTTITIITATAWASQRGAEMFHSHFVVRRTLRLAALGDESNISFISALFCQ